MKLISRKPLIISSGYEDGYKISLVLHPLWDDALIKIIEENDLQPGDIIDPYLIKKNDRACKN